MENLEVKQSITQLHTAFDEFKKANDARLKEIEKKGSSDPLTEERVEKLNEKITTLQEKLEEHSRKSSSKLVEIEKLAARPGSVAGVQDGDDIEHKKAFVSFMRKGELAGLQGLQTKAMSVGSDADGGYLVPRELSTKMVTRLFDTTPMRQLANVENISGDALEIPVDRDEAEAKWAGETETRSETATPQVGMLRIPAHEIYAMPKATQKFLDDAAADVEGWLSKKLADKFSRRENNAFLNGTGVGQPRGILSYPTSTADDATRLWGTIQHVATGVSADFPASTPADILIDLQQTLRTPYQQGASWLMARKVIGKIRKFKEATTNAYIWQPGLTAGAPSLLLGCPLTISEDMPALAANSLSVAFGNFKEAYTIVDRVGIRVLRDPFTGKPFVSFYTTKRVGGDVTNTEAVKVLKFI